jgi:hypothetical protein
MILVQFYVYSGNLHILMLRHHVIDLVIEIKAWYEGISPTPTETKVGTKTKHETITEIVVWR